MTFWFYLMIAFCIAAVVVGRGVFSTDFKVVWKTMRLQLLLAVLLLLAAFGCHLADDAAQRKQMDNALRNFDAEMKAKSQQLLPGRSADKQPVELPATHC